ncbi:unknown [Firmicutes bacterium CAG:95]|nr:unknown [Firmicutes bacterium CAG:95]
MIIIPVPQKPDIAVIVIRKLSPKSNRAFVPVRFFMGFFLIKAHFCSILYHGIRYFLYLCIYLLISRHISIQGKAFDIICIPCPAAILTQHFIRLIIKLPDLIDSPVSKNGCIFRFSGQPVIGCKHGLIPGILNNIQLSMGERQETILYQIQIPLNIWTPDNLI